MPPRSRQDQAAVFELRIWRLAASRPTVELVRHEIDETSEIFDVFGSKGRLSARNCRRETVPNDDVNRRQPSRHLLK